jgi:hypothetical protein
MRDNLDQDRKYAVSRRATIVTVTARTAMRHGAHQDGEASADVHS